MKNARAAKSIPLQSFVCHVCVPPKIINCEHCQHCKQHATLSPTPLHSNHLYALKNYKPANTRKHHRMYSNTACAPC